MSDRWRHQLRVEAIADADSPLLALICLAGKRAAPPEESGGPWAFLAKQQHHSAGYALEILADIQDNGVDALRERYDEIRLLLQWLNLEKFDPLFYKFNWHRPICTLLTNGCIFAVETLTCIWFSFNPLLPLSKNNK